MEICYISPKTSKKQKNIRIYDLAIVTLFKTIASIPDPTVKFMFILCILLALAAAIQAALNESNKTNKWDKELEKHEKRKRIKKMLEEQQEEANGNKCTNVDTKNMI